MAEIELIDKKSFSSEQSDENSVKTEDSKLQRKKSFKSTLFIIFLSILLFSLIIGFIYQIYSSKIYNQNQPSNLEKAPTPKKLEERKIIPYETPNKVEGILDYILYPYHSEIIRNLDDYEFIRDSLGKISLKMVFNSNFHGDYAMGLHTRANYHHVLVLIETEKGNRFGGYTSDNFTPQTFGLTSTSIELFKKDNSAFLFNLDSKKVYLLLRDKFLSSGGISNFPEYYGDENTQENELTNGEKEFNIKAFEAYNVLFFQEFGDENNKMGVYKNFVK